MSKYHLSQIEYLESEAIYIIREVSAQFERCAMLFSGGKDSIVLVRLAQKAFYPSRIPFPLLHVDTGQNFPETIAFRDQLVAEIGVRLLVRSVADTIAAGRAQEEMGPNASRNALQTITLLDAIHELRLDACLGGARRDEEKVRAKERIFSHRNEFSHWNPTQQQPEVWHLLNGKKHQGEHFRVFPLSNWTELDVWRYIAKEKLGVPSIYFAHQREVIERRGVLLANSPIVRPTNGERIDVRSVRCRTVGDITCTGFVESSLTTVDAIIHEIATSRMSERSSRVDDRRTEMAMEDRKLAGYF